MRDIGTISRCLPATEQYYLLKPINIQELAAITDKIAEHQSLRRENRKLTERFEEVSAATEDALRLVRELNKTAAKGLGLETIGFFLSKARNK